MGKKELRDGKWDDSAHGKVQDVYNESSKAGLPMEGTPMTTDKDGMLTPMPSYRTDIGKGTWYHAGKALLAILAHEMIINLLEHSQRSNLYFCRVPSLYNLQPMRRFHLLLRLSHGPGVS